MKEFKQILILTSDPSYDKLVTVRVLYLDMQSMCDADRAMWANFEKFDGYLKDAGGLWHEDSIFDFDGPTDIAKWLGIESRNTLGSCFIEVPPGPPPGVITGVYVVNLTGLPPGMKL